MSTPPLPPGPGPDSIDKPPPPGFPPPPGQPPPQGPVPAVMEVVAQETTRSVTTDASPTVESFWVRFLSKPKVVVAYSIFGGALLAQLESAKSTGHLDFSIAGFAHMAGAAAFSTAVTLGHLYLPSPNRQLTTTTQTGESNVVSVSIPGNRER